MPAHISEVKLYYHSQRLKNHVRSVPINISLIQAEYIKSQANKQMKFRNEFSNKTKSHLAIDRENVILN